MAVYREFTIQATTYYGSSLYNSSKSVAVYSLADSIRAGLTTIYNSTTADFKFTVTFEKSIESDTKYRPTSVNVADWNYNLGDYTSQSGYFSSGDTGNRGYTTTDITTGTSASSSSTFSANDGFDPSNDTMDSGCFFTIPLVRSDDTAAAISGAATPGHFLTFKDGHTFTTSTSTSSVMNLSEPSYMKVSYSSSSFLIEISNQYGTTTNIANYLEITSSNNNSQKSENAFYSVEEVVNNQGNITYYPYGYLMDTSLVLSTPSGPNCMDQDTKVLCLDKDLTEKYIEVKKLKPGDIVKTYKRGYKRINKIGYDVSPNDVNSDRLTAARFVLRKTDQNNLTEDLFVSARHLILVDSLTPEQERNEIETFGKVFKVEDKFLLQARHHPDFELVKEHGFYRYFQMTLENDGDQHLRHGIYTNGYLTETTCQHDYETHLKGLRQV